MTLNFNKFQTATQSESSFLSSVNIKWMSVSKAILLIISTLSLFLWQVVPNLASNAIMKTYLQVIVIFYMFFENLSQFIKAYRENLQGDDKKRAAGSAFLFIVGFLSSIYGLYLIKEGTFTGLANALGLATFPHSLGSLIFKNVMVSSTDYIFNILYATIILIGGLLHQQGYSTLGLTVVLISLLKAAETLYAQFNEKPVLVGTEFKRYATVVLALVPVVAYYFWVWKKMNFEFPVLNFFGWFKKVSAE